MDHFRNIYRRVTGRGNNSRSRQDRRPSPTPDTSDAPAPQEPAYRDWDMPVYDSPAASPPSWGDGGRGAAGGDGDVLEVDGAAFGSRTFVHTFKTFRDCFYHNQTVARGMGQSDKGIFPESVLEQLHTRTGRRALASSAGFDAPMMFSVRSARSDARAYCGVMQFEPAHAVGAAADVLDLGEVVYLPNWIMDNLGAEDGAELVYEQVFLPQGTSVVLQPLDRLFYERAKVNDPRNLLESMLSKNCVLWRGECVNCYDTTTGSVIPLRVTRLEPADAVCIVDADLRTEFEAMPGLEDYEKIEREKALAAAAAKSPNGGATSRHPGDAAAGACANSADDQMQHKEEFDERMDGDEDEEDEEEDDNDEEEEEEDKRKQPYVPFGGQGHSLRSSSDSIATSAQPSTMFPTTTIPGPAAPAASKTPGAGAAAAQQQQGGGMTSGGEPEDTSDCTRCPNCDKYIANVSYQLHAMRCARFNTRCPVCHESVPRTALAAHQKAQHEPVRCDQCGALVPPPALAEHRASECPEGLVGCPYCELRVLRKQLPAHERECGAKSAPCPVCGTAVAKNRLAEHMALGCVPPRHAPSPLPAVPTWPGAQNPTVIEDDDGDNDGRAYDESLVQCPKCHRAFSVGAIVDHVDQCGKAASPVFVADDARPRETFACPFCQRTDFGDELAYLDHMTECQTRGSGGGGGAPAHTQLPCPQCGTAFRSEDALNAHYLQAHCSSKPTPPRELRCRFCHIFTSTNPRAIQMHEAICSPQFNAPM